MNALSLAQLAPNETCARPNSPLRDIARLSHNDETAPERGFGSAPARNRTWNLRIKSPLLCQLSYKGRYCRW